MQGLVRLQPLLLKALGLRQSLNARSFGADSDRLLASQTLRSDRISTSVSVQIPGHHGIRLLRGTTVHSAHDSLRS